MTLLEKRLACFRDSHALKSKGQLAVMLHITRLAAENGLPLNPQALRTNKAGQVRGLGKGRVQTILKDHGIARVLAEEGGRTSRGSLGNASDYADFLNALHQEEKADLPAIEKWWIERVRDYFSGKPFIKFRVVSWNHGRAYLYLRKEVVKRDIDNFRLRYFAIGCRNNILQSRGVVLGGPKRKRVSSRHILRPFLLFIRHFWRPTQAMHRQDTSTATPKYKSASGIRGLLGLLGGGEFMNGHCFQNNQVRSALIDFYSAISERFKMLRRKADMASAGAVCLKMAAERVKSIFTGHSNLSA